MKATTPDAQMPNQLQHVLDIVNGSVTVLESAQQLSELTLGSAVLHGQEISVELVSQLEDAAQRLSTVSQGLLHVAGIATENIPTEPTTDGADRAVDRIDVEGSEEPSTALAMDTDLVEQPLEQTKGTSDTPGDGVSGRTMKTPTREKEAKKEPTTGEAKPVKPRYNERELAVVERIASSIETGKWFRQREINIDDLEKDGLQFKDEQKRRSFFSSVLGKLADDGVLTHNGKLRGGSQHMIERPELIAQVVEEGTSFKGSDAAMRHRPQIHKAVKDTSTQPDPAPRREKDATDARAPRVSPARTRRAETVALRRAADFSTAVQARVRRFIEEDARTPTRNRVVAMVTRELQIESEEGRVIIRNLVGAGMLFDSTRHKGSPVISMSAPSERSSKRNKQNEAGQTEQSARPESAFGTYFTGDLTSFKARYGTAKGLTTDRVSYERGSISLQGAEKAMLEFFDESGERKGVAYKHVITEVERTKGIRLTAKQLEYAVGVINALAGKEFVVLMEPAGRLKSSKGPRVRLQGSFMEDSHART